MAERQPGKPSVEGVSKSVAISRQKRTQMRYNIQRTSWSKYQPQMLRLPWLSSMHLRKFWTSVAQAGFSYELVEAALWYRPLSMG